MAKRDTYLKNSPAYVPVEPDLFSTCNISGRSLFWRFSEIDGSRYEADLAITDSGIVKLTGSRGTKLPYRVFRRGLATYIFGLSQLVMH